MEYTGTLNTGESDSYVLAVPSSGKVEIGGYKNGGTIQIFIYTIDGDYISGGYTISGGYNGIKYTNSYRTVVLETGKYIIVIENSIYDNNTGTYAYTFSYSFDSSTNAKVSSPKKGTLKVTAPKGANIDGFEVRYRISGEKTWATEKVETKKNLNKTFKGLKAGKKYEVQTRKYVSDEYGYTYYSSWTTNQSVTIKK